MLLRDYLKDIKDIVKSKVVVLDGSEEVYNSYLDKKEVYAYLLDYEVIEVDCNSGEMIIRVKSNKFVMKKKSKTIKNLYIQYDDGVFEEIEKGAALSYKLNGEEANVSLNFKDCSGKDCFNIIYGIINMAAEIGLFNEGEENE